MTENPRDMDAREDRMPVIGRLPDMDRDSLGPLNRPVSSHQADKEYLDLADEARSFDKLQEELPHSVKTHPED